MALLKFPQLSGFYRKPTKKLSGYISEIVQVIRDELKHKGADYSIFMEGARLNFRQYQFEKKGAK